MISIDFTDEQIEALHHERFHHPHPRVQEKMEAVYLKSQGLPHQDICRLSRISENTLRAYLRQFQEGGIERLKRLDFAVPTSELADHRETLEGRCCTKAGDGRTGRAVLFGSGITPQPARYGASPGGS